MSRFELKNPQTDSITVVHLRPDQESEKKHFVDAVSSTGYPLLALL